ncbi:MAG: VCBS repeat-containing protein, partial [Actinomycetota bacterium]|nr:VCBS repeat-containing protein [Actinomycetota bacterium]
VLVGYHLIGSYDIRPAWCDLDADGDRDLVVGFGPGSLSLLLLLTMQDLEVVDVQVIPGANDRYAYAWGETFPACGDVDGDGLAELAIGLGEGSTASISMLDDHESGYAPMTTAFRSLVRTLPTTATLGLQYWETGAAKPVLADVDGDGRDEIVVGRSAGGRGTISVFDDAETGFVVMLPLSPSEGVIDAVTDADYRYLDGATEVAAGDVDGDGRAEIVVATRRAGETGIDVIDDALTGFAPLLESAVQIAPDGGAGAPLELLDPGLGDIDGDGRLEVSLGMGATEGGLGRVQVLDDLETGFAPLVWTADEEGIVEAPAEAGIVWPAIEANPQP